jgi:hypothetical protein
VKIFCAYRKCRSGRCVKNVSQAARANRTDVNAALCRPLHPAAKVVRFCGPGHRKACSARALVARGQREGLDLEQYCLLFLALVRIGAPWTAALTMLQLVCGERADCMRQARFGWLQHMDPSDDQPATIRIAKVNGKTKAREIPVAPGVAALVHTWSTQGLTHGPSGARWPFAGDPERQAARRFLFPGCETGGAQGTRRNWASRSVSGATGTSLPRLRGCCRRSARQTYAEASRTLSTGSRSTVWARTASSAAPLP